MPPGLALWEGDGAWHVDTTGAAWWRAMLAGAGARSPWRPTASSRTPSPKRICGPSSRRRRPSRRSKARRCTSRPTRPTPRPRPNPPLLGYAFWTTDLVPERIRLSRPDPHPGRHGPHRHPHRRRRRLRLRALRLLLGAAAGVRRAVHRQERPRAASRSATTWHAVSRATITDLAAPRGPSATARGRWPRRS